MVVTTRDKNELELELHNQLHLLQKSCKEFDEGDLLESRNIARGLRVILTGDAHGDLSLFERAGRGDQTFPDTRILTHPRNLFPEFTLTGIVFGYTTIGVRAFLDDAGSNGSVPYCEWLEQTVADDKEGNKFPRHRLIKAVANLAGGTHYPSDIRDYYARLEKTEITATSGNTEVSVALRDIEKHSLRQIAFEVLTTFGKEDGKGVRAEYGASLYRSSTFLLYPGRMNHMSIETRNKTTPAPFVQVKDHGFDGLSGLMAKLPYEGTSKNAKCPCESGLRFKSCCAIGHNFDDGFIDAYERRHSLGKYESNAKFGL